MGRETLLSSRAKVKSMNSHSELFLPNFLNLITIEDGTDIPHSRLTSTNFSVQKFFMVLLQQLYLPLSLVRRQCAHNDENECQRKGVRQFTLTLVLLDSFADKLGKLLDCYAYFEFNMIF